MEGLTPFEATLLFNYVAKNKNVFSQFVEFIQLEEFDYAEAVGYANAIAEKLHVIAKTPPLKLFDKDTNG